MRGEQKRKREAVRRGRRPLRGDGYKRGDAYNCEDGYARVSWPLSFGLEGRPFIARGEPHFVAEPRDRAPTNALGEPKTLPHAGVFRARNSPIIASPVRKKTVGIHSMWVSG